MPEAPRQVASVAASLCAFGLSLTSGDGLMSILAFGFTTGVVALVLFTVV